MMILLDGAAGAAETTVVWLAPAKPRNAATVSTASASEALKKKNFL
jgi:hypothetical protein